MKKMKRLAIMSATGTAQKRTIPGVMERQICEIVGIQGRNPEKTEAVSKKYSIPFHCTDPAELLDTVHPDFAFIGSPPFLHLEQIRLCTDRHIPVLCEKPLCITASDAREIQRNVEASGIDFRLAHHLRHQPGIREARKIIDSGRLGHVRRASLQWAFWVREEAPSTTWKSDPRTGGHHAFFDSGIHAIDLMLYLLPPPRRLAALGIKARFEKTFDTISVVVDCGDAVAELGSSQSTRFPLNALTIDLEDGTIHAPRALSELPIESMQVISAAGTEVKAFQPQNPYGEEIADFVRLLDGEKTNATTLAESVRGVEILNAITLASHDGVAVALTGNLQ